MSDPIKVLLKHVCFHHLVLTLSLSINTSTDSYDTDTVAYETKANVTYLIFEMLDASLSWSLRGLLENKSIPVLCMDAYTNYLTMLASKRPIISTDVEIFQRPVSKNNSFPEFVRTGGDIWKKRIRRYWSKDYCKLMQGKLTKCSYQFERAYNNVFSGELLP